MAWLFQTSLCFNQLLFCRMLLSGAWESFPLCWVWRINELFSYCWHCLDSLSVVWPLSHRLSLLCMCPLKRTNWSQYNSVHKQNHALTNFTLNWMTNLQSWSGQTLVLFFIFFLIWLACQIEEPVQKHICQHPCTDHVKSNSDGALMSLCTINPHVWLCEIDFSVRSKFMLFRSKSENRLSQTVVPHCLWSESTNRAVQCWYLNKHVWSVEPWSSVMVF